MYVYILVNHLFLRGLTQRPKCEKYCPLSITFGFFYATPKLHFNDCIKLQSKTHFTVAIGGM